MLFFDCVSDFSLMLLGQVDLPVVNIVGFVVASAISSHTSVIPYN